jgi:hypothetical protein
MIRNRNSNRGPEPRQNRRPTGAPNGRHKHTDRQLPGFEHLSLLTAEQLLEPIPLPPLSLLPLLRQPLHPQPSFPHPFPLQPIPVQPYNTMAHNLPSSSRSNPILRDNDPRDGSYPQGSFRVRSRSLPIESIENPIQMSNPPQGDSRGNEGASAASRWARWAVDGDGRESGRVEEEDVEIIGASSLLLNMKGKYRIP